MRVERVFWSACWAGLCLSAVSHAAEQASFDCGKATTVIEKAICGDPALAAADRKLAETYQSALGKLSEEGHGSLRDGQRQWLRLIRLVCDTSVLPKTVKTDQTPAKCLADAYAERQTQLEMPTAAYGGITIRRGERFEAARSFDPEDSSGEHPGFSVLEESFPQIDNPRNDADRAFNKAAQDFAKDVKLDAEGAADITAGYEIVSVSDKLISINFETGMYGHGAAHPIGESAMLNWLVAEGRPLNPDDIFVKGSGWRKFVIDRCRAELSKDEEYDVRRTGKVGDGPTRPERWRFGKDGLRIHFNQYEVASYAAGEPEVVIPWADLKPYLTAAGAALAGGSPM